MANKIPVLTQLKAVAAAAKNFTMKNVSDLATTAVAAIEEVEQNAVPKTRKVNGKALSADITLNASDVGAAASGHTHSGYVPTTRKVNNKALSADISLTASDVGVAATSHSHSNYVPATRKVNGKALSADITLGASDVGAAPTSHSHSNYLTTSQRGAANGVASLGADGKVPASQLSSTGGLLPQIIITTSAGAIASCSGEPLGNESLGTLGTGTVKTFEKLPGYGVYTVEVSKDGFSKSATITVDTVKRYKVDLPLDYSTTLKNNTWSQIDMVSRSGKASSVWSIGDEINITVSGETLTLVILDFNHDDLADGSGKAGITFGLKNLMKDKRAINSSHTFYQNTTMHSWLNSTVYNGMPAELRNVIKSVNKTVLESVNYPPQSVPELTYGAISTKVFLPAAYEVLGANGDSKEGARYSYYATNSSTSKKLSNGSGSVSDWWTRSYFQGLTPSLYWYCGAQESGMPAAAPSESKGVSFNFCV